MEGMWEVPTERLMTGTGIEFRSISFMTRILRERGRIGRGVETAKPLGVELGKKTRIAAASSGQGNRRGGSWPLLWLITAITATT